MVKTAKALRPGYGSKPSHPARKPKKQTTTKPLLYVLMVLSLFFFLDLQKKAPADSGELVSYEVSYEAAGVFALRFLG